MSPWLFAIASTMSLPLANVVFLISSPWAAKNPFWIPRSSGNPFEIGSPSRLIVVRVIRWGAPDAFVPRASSSPHAPKSIPSRSNRLPRRVVRI